MTASTTRERVAAAMVGCPIEKFRGLPDHTREWWLKRADEALAAMQPPTETRNWTVSERTRLLFVIDQQKTNTGTALHLALPNLLRDFADGVSDGVLENALRRAMLLSTEGQIGRAFLRALADQEEGKSHA